MKVKSIPKQKNQKKIINRKRNMYLEIKTTKPLII